MHILDIMHNSIAAGAKRIELTVVEDTKEDFLEFTVKDNGCGMTEKMLRTVVDPFTTSRTTRKVGMGIPLLKLAAENTGGGIKLQSEVGVGTTISARFGYSHIDRQPLGNMAETMLGLVTSYENIEIVYIHKVDNREYKLDTSEIRGILGDVSFKESEVMLWLKGFLEENESELYN